MNEGKNDHRDGVLDLRYEIDEPPHKVWKALFLPQFRDAWLPVTDLADPEALSITPQKEIRYRIRESEPPHLESEVTFRIEPNPTGGTSLRIIHKLPDLRLDAKSIGAANNNYLFHMLAA